MGTKFANNAVSSLASSISAQDTTLRVAYGTGDLFPVLNDGDICVVTLVGDDDNCEIIKVTARDEDVFTIERGQEDTIPQSWPEGTRIENRVTAAYLNTLLLGYANTSGLVSGYSCAEQTWVLTEDVPAGTVITLPDEMAYIPGRHHLRLSYGGMVISPTFFVEIGEPTAPSTQFKTLIDFKAGQELNAWISPLGKAYEIDLTNRIVALEEALADLSRRVVYADDENTGE